jgi:hypothetical protein
MFVKLKQAKFEPADRRNTAVGGISEGRQNRSSISDFVVSLSDVPAAPRAAATPCSTFRLVQ